MIYSSLLTELSILMNTDRKGHNSIASIRREYNNATVPRRLWEKKGPISLDPCQVLRLSFLLLLSTSVILKRRGCLS